MSSPADTIDLSGAWRIRADPTDAGVGERWFDPSTRRDDWAPCTVPGAMQSALGPGAAGVVWYALDLLVPADWSLDDPGRERWRLRFESVATDCRVWVNGEEVGRHVGDYLPFQFDVSGAARRAVGALEGRPGPGVGRLSIVCRVDRVDAPPPPPPPAPGALVQNGHITKGFHDVLSMQHGGIWQPVSLARTSRVCALPDGVAVRADPASGEVVVDAELLPAPVAGEMTACVLGPDGRPCARGRAEFDAGAPRARLRLAVPGPIDLWDTDSPALYTAQVTLHERGRTHEGAPSDRHSVRFGFRRVTTGGPGNGRILLNGRPILLRGMLHWGHEPEHIAPAPTPVQVREEFAALRARGFNLVCLCMWYPPRHYYDIADETGMLLWQEHPVWKSPMGEEHHEEYRRLFDAFFRRDRNHPSVVIVSGSCEHERFHPDLAAWWWARAKQELPDRLCQVQTAFLGWTNPAQTDLHDEHVYESSGRWAAYLRDLQPALDALPPKPFVMGETIIGTSWLDVAAVRRAATEPAPARGPDGTLAWWVSKGLDECEAFERSVRARFGPGVLDRFRRTADRFNLQHRKYQSELFRGTARHAGWVMNQIRDVPAARLGFMDDLGRWRFSPEECRPWLGDCVLLLSTPEERRGFTAGDVACRVGISNFGRSRIGGPVEVTMDAGNRSVTIGELPLAAEPGEVAWAGVHLPLPAVGSPTRVRVSARARGAEANSWDLWVFPDMERADAPPEVVRMDGLPFSTQDEEMDFEERAYSSGWGLKAVSWRRALPDPGVLLFKAPLWRFDAPLPPGEGGRPGPRAVVTHKMTHSVADFLVGGGRVVLLASKTARGGPGTEFIVTWGQTPLIAERGPLAPTEDDRAGPHDWIADLLHVDLNRRSTRAVPSGRLGWAEHVEPLVRLVFTHDAGVPRLFDQLFRARVGAGVLIVSALDHHDPAGRWLLHLLVRHAAGPDADCDAALPEQVVRSWCADARAG